MAPEKPDDPPAPAPIVNDEDEGAIVDDEDDDLDDALAELQRIQSAKRREGKEKSQKNRIQEILPFPFAPNLRPLGISDLESAVTLENAAFTDPQHRASREKFEYRLTKCPELSMGVFHTVVPDHVQELDLFPTLETAHAVETDRPDRARSVLLAHIVATASHSKTIQDHNMEIPTDWRNCQNTATGKGHVEGAPTICLHSLAVLPKLHGCGLGKLVMKSFLQQMKALGAERVALLCQDYLVNYYERFGFKNAGKSKAQFGGGGWYDMVIDLSMAGPASAANANANANA